eukprot:731500-Rhodomonas_salina.2
MRKEHRARRDRDLERKPGEVEEPVSIVEADPKPAGRLVLGDLDDHALGPAVAVWHLDHQLDLRVARRGVDQHSLGPLGRTPRVRASAEVQLSAEIDGQQLVRGAARH